MEIYTVTGTLIQKTTNIYWYLLCKKMLRASLNLINWFRNILCDNFNTYIPDTFYFRCHYFACLWMAFKHPHQLRWKKNNEVCLQVKNGSSQSWCKFNIVPFLRSVRVFRKMFEASKDGESVSKIPRIFYLKIFTEYMPKLV